MNKKIRTSIALSLVGGFVLQLAACGTIIYPERKGQIDGRLDVGVVALDAIGLLFFFVPGIIAFAVDFSNGTIYLPGGSASTDAGDLNVVDLGSDVTKERIEQVIREQTGKNISLEKIEVNSRPEVTTLSALENEVRFL